MTPELTFVRKQLIPKLLKHPYSLPFKYPVDAIAEGIYPDYFMVGYSLSIQGTHQACRNSGMLDYRIPARINALCNFDHIIKLSTKIRNLLANMTKIVCKCSIIIARILDSSFPGFLQAWCTFSYYVK